MSKNPHPQRRDFLKTAAAGAAGAMGISALKFDKIFAQSAGSVWVNGMQINPAIDNKRVICCHDPSMLGNYPSSGVKSDFTSQNSYVDPTQVSNNMDEMAMQLAQKTNADDAWSTIFQFGSKDPGSIRVAMKTNGIGGSTTNRPKAAIYKKITDVLIKLGVQASNIVLYDACDDITQYYPAYVSLTDSTKIRAVVNVRTGPGFPAYPPAFPSQSSLWKTSATTLTALNDFAAVTLTNATGISAPADLVNGKIDILVNVAACKMHNGTGGKYSYGSCTLCMKNHLGTFTDGKQGSHSDNLHSSNGPAGPPAALFEINKHSVVLGGTPVRQQLCIVDALLSNGASGPGGAADNRTDRLVMGTFAPIVDYLTANKILLDTTIMAGSPIPAAGVSAAATILPQFLTSFGYATTDALQWIEYAPSSLPPIGGNTGSTGGTSGSGGAGSGGTTSASGGAGSGGTTSGSGGNKASGGITGDGASGGSASGGTNASGGSASGGTNASGGSASGGTNASGGSASGGTASGSGGAAATGGVATSSASGGSARTGGTTAGNGTGGSSGNSTAKGGNSESGCDVAGVDRRATRWGAMLAFGAVVAEKLRRLVSGSDRSS